MVVMKNDVKGCNTVAQTERHVLIVLLLAWHDCRLPNIPTVLIKILQRGLPDIAKIDATLQRSHVAHHPDARDHIATDYSMIRINPMHMIVMASPRSVPKSVPVSIIVSRAEWGARHWG